MNQSNSDVPVRRSIASDSPWKIEPRESGWVLNHGSREQVTQSINTLRIFRTANNFLMYGITRATRAESGRHGEVSGIIERLVAGACRGAINSGDEYRPLLGARRSERYKLSEEIQYSKNEGSSSKPELLIDKFTRVHAVPDSWYIKHSVSSIAILENISFISIHKLTSEQIHAHDSHATRSLNLPGKCSRGESTSLSSLADSGPGWRDGKSRKKLIPCGTGSIPLLGYRGRCRDLFKAGKYPWCDVIFCCR